MSFQQELENVAFEVENKTTIAALPTEKRAAYYESIIIKCMELLIAHGHSSDYLSHNLANVLNCQDRLPDYDGPGTNQ